MCISSQERGGGAAAPAQSAPSNRLSTRRNAMLLQIILHTPKWVFAVFVLLVWLGCRQLLSGSVGLAKVTVIPIAMTGLSLAGVVSAFGDSPGPLLGWAVAAAALVLLVLQSPLPASTRYDRAAREFHVAGSAVPLLLMMGIFFTKYVVGASLAMHPELRQQAAFEVGVPMLYGAFSGIFAARAVRLWKLAIGTDAVAAGARAA
ncbi:DUF6622 family protein [Variovorax paradoxus]|uniref:DUF6622 family protein n=1 Tax=Variovorax paradoxus TaxID=34073 RepID=UPI0039996CC0